MKKFVLIAAILIASPAHALFNEADQQRGAIGTVVPATAPSFSPAAPGLAAPTAPPGASGSQTYSPPVGGPVAIGQAQAQKDDAGKVTIVQAPAESKGGGFIQLSAFGWLQPYADTLAQALIGAFFTWLGASKYKQWLDQSARDALKVFLTNRASSLIADGAVKMQDKSVHVDNALLFRAASQASAAIPDALKRFGLTPDVVAAKIVDAIPQTAAGAAIIADAHKETTSEPVVVTDRPSVAPQVAAPNNPPTSAIA